MSFPHIHRKNNYEIYCVNFRGRPYLKTKPVQDIEERAVILVKQSEYHKSENTIFVIL